MLHCFTHNDIPKLITVVNHLWLGNFQSIFKDVSVTYQQHNSVKMGQGQKSEPENFKYLQPSFPHNLAVSNCWSLFAYSQMDREVWHASVHGVAKSRTQLSN